MVEMLLRVLPSMQGDNLWHLMGRCSRFASGSQHQSHPSYFASRHDPILIISWRHVKVAWNVLPSSTVSEGNGWYSRLPAVIARQMRFLTAAAWLC